MTAEGHLESKKIITVRKPIHDFLFLIWLLWTTSLYLVPFSRYSTLKFLGFDLDLWPLKVIWGRKILYHSKAHIWLPIWLLLTPSLYLVPFSKYSTSKFYGFDRDLWPLKVILGKKKNHIIRKPIYDFLFDSYGQHLTISYRFQDIRLQSFQGLTLTFDPSRSSGVKQIYTIRKPIYDFLFDFYGQHLSISYRFRDIRLQHFQGLTLTFDPSRSSGVKKSIILFESAYMTFYLTSIDTISLFRTVFEIFDFKAFRVWPWPLTPKGHLGSKNFISFESPYMTSYLTSMDNISLSRIVFEIFDFKVFRVWPWPLTPKGHLGSKIFIPSESPYMTSYLISIDPISLSRTVFEIFDFKVFRVWPWLLTPKGHLGSKNFISFESPYMTSYLTSMDNISLSRIVFEIFDFKVFRVWPWPLTPKGHLRSKNVIPFESPYMTSYLTSIDTISLSLTVLEIMQVKISKAEQNGGFWSFKGQGQVAIFFYPRKGTSSHQTASFEI